MGERYSISELEEATGQPRRTIHHYISIGLLPKAEGRGPSAYYTREHYLKLRLIGVLVDAGLRPELIGNSLAGWSVEDMEVLVAQAEGEELDDLDKIGRWLNRASAQEPRLAPRIAAELAKWDPLADEGLHASIEPMLESEHAMRSEALHEQAELHDMQARSSPSSRLPRADSWERIQVGDQLEIAYKAESDRRFRRKIEQLKELVAELFAEELESEG